MQIKKSMMPRSWPLPKKDRKKRFVSAPEHSRLKSISLLYVLRDILRIADTRKEAKKILLSGQVKVNNIPRKSDSFPVQVLDVISLEGSKKHYCLEIENKKYSLREISGKEATEKTVKIIGKKALSNERIQMNLEDGTNLIVKDSFKVGDSAIVDLKKRKVSKIIPLKKGAKVEVISGAHAGQKGKINEIESLSRGKSYKIKLDDGSLLALPYKTITVID